MPSPRYWREIPARYRLEASKCSGCGKVYYPARPVCPACRATESETVSLSKSGKVQIVLDLDRVARYDVFALEKYEHKRDRIVIDVKRPRGAVRPPTIPRVERQVGPESVGDFLVMVDPGHGGEDAGRRNPGTGKHPRWDRHRQRPSQPGSA